jgi:hypothetical protein
MELVVMAKLRLAFLFTWGLVFGLSQVLLIIIFSAFNYEPTLILTLEVFTAITTAMITALMLVKEDINGKEIFRQE